MLPDSSILGHYNHQPTGYAYNGVKPTVEQLKQDFGEHDKERAIPTLNHWHERGGLVGRGVLLDYKAYADAKGVQYSPFEAHTITIKDLEAVAEQQGTTFKEGDILIVRSGFTGALTKMNAEEQDKALGTHKTVGVEGNEEAAKWIWNKHFAAVAGDAIAFEVIPPVAKEGFIKEGKERRDGEQGDVGDLVLHQYFLSLFGLPIGELWDLEALSQQCAKSKRYTFLLTSIPLNVPGGIGSPPNAVAVF